MVTVIEDWRHCCFENRSKVIKVETYRVMKLNVLKNQYIGLLFFWRQTNGEICFQSNLTFLEAVKWREQE